MSFRWKAIPAFAIAVIAGGAALQATAAGDGTLDPSWNHVGYTTTNFGPNYAFAAGVAVRPDGRTVAVGGFSSPTSNVWALARYKPNGVLDPSFGSGGTVTTSFQGFDLADAAANQDDKTVVAGYTSSDGGGTNFKFALARYLNNGALDPSFGSGGKVITSINSYDFADAVAVDGGKIIVAGATSPDLGVHLYFVVARYNSNGSLDTSFGSGGITTTDFGQGYNSAGGLAVMGDRIVAAGYEGTRGHLDFAVARYTNDGSLDNTFGAGGKVITDFGNDAAGHAVDVHAGHIVVIGTYFNGLDHDFAAALYARNGSLVSTFGSGGKATLNVGQDDFAYSGGFGPDGTVIAAGDTGTSAPADSFAVARWTSTGAPDPEFGSGGHTVTSIGTLSGAFASGMGPDHKIVAAGYSDNSFAVARYIDDTDEPDGDVD